MNETKFAQESEPNYKTSIIVGRQQPSTIFSGCLGPTKKLEEETIALNSAIDALIEYWDNGKAIHASALVVEEFRAALKKARGN